MATRRMNEICTTMVLTLVFGVLLFHTCRGQDEPTAAAAISSQTTAMEEPKSTSQSLGPFSDPSTKNPTNSPATGANQVVHDPDASTTANALPGSTYEQAHTSSATYEATTSQPDVLSTLADSPQTLGNQPVHIDHRQHNNQDTRKELEPDTGSPTQTSVFVPLLVSGLILAAILMGLYIWKNHCHTKTSGMKLAEESYMADKENQGNTLVSVAPLNPPEDQEKPSLNGESLEAVKIQNPPAATNGHSTAKADTEL